MGNQIIRWLLALWLIAYPIVACTPLLVGSIAGGESGAYTILGGLLAGSFLLLPWLVGILVLGLLAVLTR